MYTPLYVKTNYSLLSSFISIKKLVKYCKEKNISSIAITDNNMYGAMEFYKECKKNNIKPIIGLEIELDNKKVVLLAKNYDGYKNLIKLATIASKESITLDVFNDLRDNLFVLLPFKSRDLEINCDYYGYSSIDEKREILFPNKVFLPEILCFEKNEKALVEHLMMIRDGKTVVDHEVYQEMLSGNHHFVELPYLDEVSKRIGDECNLEFPKAELLLPIYDTGTDVSSSSYLANLSKAGLNKRLNGNITNIYKERLLYELDVIDKMGFSNYFLVVYDFIKWAKKNGILVGPGRGSAAGSLVSYALGIIEIDPIEHDLLFERFLNPERVSMPDIDTDFPDIYRDDVIKYVISKYGDKRVAGIITFGTLGAKQAIRDTSRVLNIPLYKVDQITKYIPPMTKDSLKEIYKNNERFRLAIDQDESLVRMFKIASQIEGFPRHTSSHAAGIVMCQKDLDEVLPLSYSDGMYLTGYSMEHLEELGLLKMDFLGITNLTTIMNIIKDVESGEGIKIDFNKIPLDDKDALKLFEVSNTMGIFQFESTGMRNFLSNLKINSFDEICAAIALFRPGPAVNIDSFIRRKFKEEEITYLNEELKPILESTNGIIVYQEQIMQIARVYAGYTLGEADILRRAMSKKKMDVLKSEEERFIKQSMEHNHPYEEAKELFDLILNFANYGFNKSHSVAYSIVAYKMAYLKAKYPKYFFANLLTSVIGSDIKTKEYIDEAKRNNLKVLKPSINKSSNRFIVEEDGIRYPISSVHNVGIVTCSEILKNRETPYQDIYDFVSRVHSRGLTKKTLESLIDASCFEEFGYNHRTLIESLDLILNYATLSKDLDPSLIMKPEIEVVEEFEKAELMKREKDTFGFYFSNHPTVMYKVKENNIVNLIDAVKYFNRRINTIVLIEKIKTIDTKRQEKMAFIVGSDESGTMDFTLFPKNYFQNQNLKVGDLVKIYGNVEKRLNNYQIIVDKIDVLN